ncbi:MAG: chromosomal replication initiator protein DnaA [Candidatus Peribacteraceae bacterium]|nr:chromosomal replication initiator protein DnaA [Candidatus Peribacteraceae bacterium]
MNPSATITALPTVALPAGRSLSEDRAKAGPIQSVPSASSTDLWLEILRKLESKMPRGQFITWFKNTMILGNEEGELIVGLPLPTYLTWHMEHYRVMTLEVAQEVDPSVRRIVYTVDTGLKDNPERTIDLLEHFPELKKRKLPGRQEIKLAEGIVTKILSTKYTLENFVVGTNNRLAHAACLAVCNEPGGKYNPLFLYGGVGLGKTHLLQATGSTILKNHPRATVVYVTSEDFTNQVVESVQHGKMEQFNRRYRTVDVLIIDDIQFIANKERTQEIFFHTFNTLYEEHKQIILSADRPPQELQLEDRLKSRFARGMIADVSKPDYETRLAILREKAAEHHIFLDGGVLEFIAQHVTRNVRELEGILTQAVALYELEQRMPTVRAIAEIMSKLSMDPLKDEENVGFTQAPKRRPTFQEIMEAVSRYYSVSLQDMTGASRVREILLPRQIAMCLGKKHLGLSTTRLGELFGNRDHTTVMNALEKIEEKFHSDPQLLREVRTIEVELGLA